MTYHLPMSAREEAATKAPDMAGVGVLEPSPPAVTAPPWFADDPAVPAARPAIGPTDAFDQTWDQRCRDTPTLSDWCAERWLGAWRRLPPIPEQLLATRDSLHAVAEHVLSPARHAANGKIGLRWTRGGFGTPYFVRDGRDVQVRVDGTELVVDDGGVCRRAPLTTLREAAAFVGVAPGAPTAVFTPTTPLDLDAPLVVDPVAAAFLSDWFGFATSVLEQLRAEASADLEPSRVQLWPEHFDVAVELGPVAEGRRAGYGGSPGDEPHPGPYLYVVPWEHPHGRGWDETHFRGSRLACHDLQEAADQRGTALGFLRERRGVVLAGS